LEVASTGYKRGERLPLRGSLTGQAILEGGPVKAEDLRTDPRFHRPDLARAQDWVRALVVPLLASVNGAPAGAAVSAAGEGSPAPPTTPLGAFSVYSAGLQEGRFVESEWDEKVLTILAHYAALAVHNAARQEALRDAQSRHAMAETFAAVGDIAANLLHQLNNRVGTIPVRVEGIQDKCQAAVLADPYLAANLNEIERSANEAMDAVRESLAHLHPLQLGPVDVAACAQAAVRSANLPEEVTVRLEDLESLPTVVAGERSLTLVFANLFQNAAQAMSGHGVVTVYGSLSQDEAADWVEIAVRDNGPGIPPELHDRIFELSFSQNGRAARVGSLGFGLWWVKSLMVRLGGSVSVESDGQHGTTFTLRLPRDGRADV
jgi:signal transduction histidine kinase